MKIKIDDITIAEDRQRKDFGDIEELAKSIEQTNGVIQPIVVDEANLLIAGERRLRACKHLGHTTIEARRLKSLSQSEKHLIELEENVKRKNLTWQEHVSAVKRYHEMRMSAAEDHTAMETALELGLSPTKVNKDLLIAAEVEKDPKLAETKKYGNVYNKSVRNKEAAQDLELSKIDVGLSAPPPANRFAQLLNVDFAEWAAEYDGPLFNFLHCDFPYGINIDKAGDKLALEEHEQYEDSPEVFDTLINVLRDHKEKFLAQNAHVMFWTATKNLSYTRQRLHKAGFRCQPNPLIWAKMDGKGVSPDPRYNPRHVYETALIAYQGSRQIVKVKDDLIQARVVNQLHRNEKPLEMLRHFMTMFVDNKTLVLDPTCGSGNAVKVAEELGAKYALGLEINPTIYEKAKGSLKL